MKTYEEFGYVTKNDIMAFQRGPFSQWYGGYKSQKSDFYHNGVKYNCTEQWMMAGKARLFEDQESLDAIMEESDPKFQKALGRKVKGFDKSVWDTECENIVYRGNILKFSQNPELLKFLLDTDDLILVEASPWDKIWGVGTGPDDDSTFDRDEWQGLNLLGMALMSTRDALEEVESWIC
jgi:ribA/ribD-fused uncharacterized protein